MDAINNAITVLSYLIIILSVVPLIRNDYWIFRVFEYPRLQKLVINLFLIGLVLTRFELTLPTRILIGALVLNLAYLSYQVIPFTFLGKKQILPASESEKNSQISLFIGNVYQYNKQADNYLKNILSKDPDVIMLVETDQWWADKMSDLDGEYPHQIRVPLDNTYGMMFYSRFVLKNPEVKYLVEKDIPSVHTSVQLPSGQMISFHGLHPTPPVPNENPRSTERDKEILMVGKTSKNDSQPVIVAGDLNDVAWSYTTELFSKISGLLDPRRGRGFFNTFHAKYMFLRFPLDHIFCSKEFSLLEIKRMPACGSDHFPMFIKLQFSPSEPQIEEPQADADELEQANEKIQKAT